MGNHKGLPLQIYQPPTTIHFPQAGGYPFSDQPLSTVSKPSYWLTIGDVSGHGVPAGLVMMMAQTAIRTALKTHGQGNPKQVLEIANAILYDNIKKMGEDKYMSLTLLSVQPSGTIYYSGLHQDIMVYRAAKKTVELVETQGIWMGISNEISNMLKTDYFVLDGGDAVLLYTDGVTEAINAQGAMFSDEKLIELFRCCGHLSPAAVKTEILTALQNYSCTDDVTMIIMKRTEG
jgi:sigma-B regulation protein RsbU (phosphoserine phosphatase)